MQEWEQIDNHREETHRTAHMNGPISMTDSVSKREKKEKGWRREGELGLVVFYYPWKPEVIIQEYEIDEAKIRGVMIMLHGHWR